MRRIFLNANQQIGIYQVSAKFKIAEKSAILLCISKGLEAFGLYSKEEYGKDHAKYAKPLVEKVEENKRKRQRLEEAKKKAEAILPKGTKDFKAFKRKWSNKSASLHFEERKAEYIITQKRYVPSDVFKEICNDVKALGGDHYGEGKKSHWKIPKKGVN